MGIVSHSPRSTPLVELQSLAVDAPASPRFSVAAPDETFAAASDLENSFEKEEWRGVLHGSTGAGQRSTGPRRGRWSQAEIARLRDLYGKREEAAVARELNRPLASVRKMAEELFRSKPKSGPWTADEVQRLKEYLGVSSTRVISLILGREEPEVREQIQELGRIQQSGRWSRDEVALLKRVYGTRTDDDLAVIFGRSVESIKRTATKLALAKDKAFVRRMSGTPTTRMPRWSDEEQDQLREMYPAMSNLEIAHALNRSVKSVVSKAHNLGLKKDPSRLRQMGRENVSLRYKG